MFYIFRWIWDLELNTWLPGSFQVEALNQWLCSLFYCQSVSCLSTSMWPIFISLFFLHGTFCLFFYSSMNFFQWYLHFLNLYMKTLGLFTGYPTTHPLHIMTPVLNELSHHTKICISCFQILIFTQTSITQGTYKYLYFCQSLFICWYIFIYIKTNNAYL